MPGRSMATKLSVHSATSTGVSATTTAEYTSGYQRAAASTPTMPWNSVNSTMPCSR